MTKRTKRKSKKTHTIIMWSGDKDPPRFPDKSAILKFTDEGSANSYGQAQQTLDPELKYEVYPLG